MSFKIADKVIIHDGSWSILIKGTSYDTGGIYGAQKVTGVIRAIDCRLPLGPPCFGGNETPSPIKGMSLYCGGVMFHDLLVQTEDGFVFTSTRHVRLVPVKPKKYFVCVLGVKIEVTKDQYEDFKASEDAGVGKYYTGTIPVEEK